MAILPFKKNKKSGTSSKISELKSPYFKKPVLPKRVLKREKKKFSFLVPPARLKAPRKSRRKLWIFLTVLAAAGLGYLIFFSNVFNLRSWEIEEDGILVNMDNPISQIIAPLKGKSIIFINKKNIISQITALHPDIKKIEIKKIFPQKIKIVFEKYPAAANIVNIFGGNENDITACQTFRKRPGGIQKKFLIDSIGFLSEENSENPELPYLKIGTSEVLAVHSFVLPQEKLDYILKAITLFKEKFDLKIVNSVYKIREREVHLCTEKFFEVWIDMEKDLDQQLNKLKRALAKLDIYQTPLAYIDLRISGTNSEKIIFKKIGK